jgi:hypothetical protein
MLEHKGVEFRTVRLPTGLQPLVTRLLGFPEPTVPALRAGAQRVQPTRAIARFLEAFVRSRRCSHPTLSCGAESRRPSAGATRCFR